MPIAARSAGFVRGRSDGNVSSRLSPTPPPWALTRHSARQFPSAVRPRLPDGGWAARAGMLPRAEGALGQVYFSDRAPSAQPQASFARQECSARCRVRGTCRLSADCRYTSGVYGNFIFCGRAFPATSDRVAKPVPREGVAEFTDRGGRGTMSEQSNEDVVRGVYEAFGRGDLPGVLGRLTDDVEWSPSSIPFAGTR